MTRIVADTTCGLAPEMAQKLGIPLIPQIINFGEESYREGVDMDHAGFMARLQTSRMLPKTAAPYPGDFIEAFERFVAAGESVVCIHPSADVSGTVRSAITAKDACSTGDIRIIDTRTIAGPLATLVLEADKLAKAGASADAVEAFVARHDATGAHLLPGRHARIPAPRRPHRRRRLVGRQRLTDQADPHLH